MNILVVDDEVAARRNMVKVLENVVTDAEIACAVNATEALEQCKNTTYDVAFLDIEMPGKNGIDLAKELKESSPLTNIVIVTAYDQYAVEAFRLFASGYILKPATEEEVEEVIRNLRRPVDTSPKGLYVQCFGNFEVFYNGRIVHFGRSQAKEMLAYLIDRRGAGVTGEQLRAVLWEDEAEDTERQRDYMYRIWYDLRNTLKSLNCGNAVQHTRNIYAVDVTKIRCDYYDALERTSGKMLEYTGEYMAQYSWAEKSDFRWVD